MKIRNKSYQVQCLVIHVQGWVEFPEILNDRRDLNRGRRVGRWQVESFLVRDHGQDCK